MSVETLNMLSIVSFILSGVFLIISIVLFIVFKINRIISELSGYAQKNAIKKLKSNRTINNTKELSIKDSKSEALHKKYHTDKLTKTNDTLLLNSNNMTVVLENNINSNERLTKNNKVTVDTLFIVEEDIILCEGRAI